MIFPSIVALLSLVLGSSPASDELHTPGMVGQDTVTPPLIGPSLRYGVDTTVSPCLDFYQYVNGDWRSRTMLGGTKTSQAERISMFSDTYVRAQQRLQVLLDSARAAFATTADPTLKVLGTFYESCMVADSLEKPSARSRRDTMPVRDSSRAVQCLQRTIGTLGGALGQAFAKELLVSNARSRMEQLIETLRTAIAARLERNPWMNQDEKTLALARLKKLHLRIGMPTEMADYQGLTLSPTHYQQNKTTIRNFENVRWSKSIGANIRDQWKMSLLTPNAMYSSYEHAIEIPAVMFMPPFFDAKAEDAVNFAGVGYVVAHEIFHSLTGQLRTVENAEMNMQIKRFKAMNSSLGTVDGWGTDGERTYGEDIADLGGVLAAYDAWQSTIKTQRPVPMIDGFTPDQRFYVALGRIWRSKWRGSGHSRDPHAAPFARVNAMVMQSPSFAQAFGCPEQAPMVPAADKRVSIW